MGAFKEKLTSAEMGKLWVTYMGNSMSKRYLMYYLQHVEDQDIKKIVENALNICESILQEIKKIFIEESFPVPIGFTDEDVHLNTPRLFSDEFYLHYLKYAGKAGLSIYSIAVPIMTREDIRDFFINTLNSTVKLINEVNNALMAKGYLIKPPLIPTPEKVDFIKKQNYLNGFIGNVRPLHALEITHLYLNNENNVTSKALLIGFSQVAENEQIKEFFIRGKEMTNKHIVNCSQHLNKENLPALPLLDHLVSTSTISPFSDKLMLAHKIDMFSMKIRAYGNGMSLNGRHDIGGMYARFVKDVGLYVEDAANIMIDHGWMEQPPEAADRDHLASN
jgi:spore coat protein CotF